MEKKDIEQCHKAIETNSNDLALQPSHNGELISFTGLDPALAAKIELLNNVYVPDGMINRSEAS